MPFNKMVKTDYPPRLWGLVGYPGGGKTTFAMRMRSPILPIDADHRFREVLDVTDALVYELSDNPADHVDTDRIAQLLMANMPGSGVRTIVTDSLTAIIKPLVVEGMQAHKTGREKNLAAAFAPKAIAMAQLQDVVTRWGTDVLWIYHLNDGRDGQGEKETRATVSKTELVRLLRCLNLKLQIVKRADDVRGIKVVWARRGRTFPEVPILWDDSGTWLDMPEKIEHAVYDGLTEEERDALQEAIPTSFNDDAEAIEWGFDRGKFKAIQHARNAYEEVARESGMKGVELHALWIDNVLARPDIIDPPPDEESEVIEDVSDLDNYFPREDAEGVTPQADEVQEPVPGPTEFWTRVRQLKGAGRVSPDVEKHPPVSTEITAAKASGDWSKALAALSTQIRG